ncbi:hypothetical protein WJ59_20415 [Burkholderia gladioli]|uniref:hypothetical protein n=1 Tax=Burkholderia gladioli TaxID=28095 RepID=UPI0007541665|nr:hypothetical protein [Burkholderia gladioli]KVM64124.1 hypothetical protein WJ59_20415 [Burkholderia gladioli]
MNWKAPTWMVPFGAICAGVGVLAAIFHNDALVWPGLWLFVATLVAANIDRFERLKAGSSGFEFEAKKVVEEARTTVAEMQLLAKHLASISLSLVKRSARIGGFPAAQEEKIREQTIELLRRTDVPEADFDDVLEEWHRWVLTDYVFGILGNSMVPGHIDQSGKNEWSEMRGRAFEDNRPTVDELTTWLGRHNFLTPERQGYLDDYAHYIQHKQHRRFEVWERHSEWPRLDAA